MTLRYLRTARSRRFRWILPCTALLAACLTSACNDREDRRSGPHTIEIGNELYYERMDSLRDAVPVMDTTPLAQERLALSVAPDSALVTYLHTYAPVLDSIVTLFQARAQLTEVSILDTPQPELRDGVTVKANRNILLHSLLERANMTSVFRDERFPGCVFVQVGGIDRTHAGYLYAANGCHVPTMDPDLLVVIAPIQDNWYLYKTL